MNFLCPACRTPLPRTQAAAVVPCTQCGVQVDLTRMDTAPGTARLWPDVDLEGEAVGPYRLVKRLAAGGMGIVYEAEGPDGACAVKVLSALLAAEPELRTRFRREATALRTLRHPGVVKVYAEGEDRGFCWYAMERVAGRDLRARIAEGPLSPAEVETLARKLLEALAAVHARGFVHRDVKPGNILLAADGPKLCDFGIARLDGATTLTESAAVLGSLRYMAPEQRLGRPSALSDLYSLGLVLHEALTQGVPGETDLAPSTPRRLRRLIARLTAERQAERVQSAREALALLEARRPAGLIAAASAAGIVLAAGAGWALWPGASGAPETSALAEPKEKDPPTKAMDTPRGGAPAPAEKTAPNQAAAAGDDRAQASEQATLQAANAPAQAQYPQPQGPPPEEQGLSKAQGPASQPAPNASGLGNVFATDSGVRIDTGLGGLGTKGGTSSLGSAAGAAKPARGTGEPTKPVPAQRIKGKPAQKVLEPALEDDAIAKKAAAGPGNQNPTTGPSNGKRSRTVDPEVEELERLLASEELPEAKKASIRKMLEERRRLETEEQETGARVDTTAKPTSTSKPIRKTPNKGGKKASLPTDSQLDEPK